jgi:aryl-alcohol dehydrogenase-like predicted oxidoreductase
MRISLGTAQFGLDYGITNSGGQVPASDVPGILATARQNAVVDIDTAAAYGSAEDVLQSQAGTLQHFQITTKIPSLMHLDGRDAVDALTAHIRASHAKLGATLQTVLLHDIADLLRPEGLTLWSALEREAATLSIKNLGISVYDRSDIDRALSLVRPDVVQVPISVFDQRLLQDGSLDILLAQGCSIEARSIFLQGLVLSDPATIPYHLRALKPAAFALQAEAAASGASALEIALGCLRLVGCIDRAVVGVTSAQDLADICAAKKAPVPAVSYPNFRVLEPRVVDPRYWSQLMEEKRAS